MKNTPAFPFPYPGGHGEKVIYGMTMRQWYKGVALTGYLASFANPSALGLPKDFPNMAEFTAKAADAMLAEDAEHEGRAK